MTARDDGGPAFPLGVAVSAAGDVYFSDHAINGAGMTLRDWFAGQCLSGIIDTANSPHATRAPHPSEIARLAYAVADAMLAARKEGAS